MSRITSIVLVQVAVAQSLIPAHIKKQISLVDAAFVKDSLQTREGSLPPADGPTLMSQYRQAGEKGGGGGGEALVKLLLPLALSLPLDTSTAPTTPACSLSSPSVPDGSTSAAFLTGLSRKRYEAIMI